MNEDLKHYGPDNTSLFLSYVVIRDYGVMVKEAAVNNTMTVFRLRLVTLMPSTDSRRSDWGELRYRASVETGFPECKICIEPPADDVEKSAIEAQQAMAVEALQQSERRLRQVLANMNRQRY